MPNEKFAGQMDEKKAKNANKPNTKSTGQSAFKKAKFQLFDVEKCQMATLNTIQYKGLAKHRKSPQIKPEIILRYNELVNL